MDQEDRVPRENIPGNDLLLKFPALTVQKEPRHIIYFNRVEIPEEMNPIRCDSEYLSELKERVRKAELIKPDGLMDESKLFDLVHQATNGNCQKFRPQRAAQSTNMIQEVLNDVRDISEMFLHQVVFSPIAELFSCFDLSKYCAGQHISCAHIVNCRDEQGGERWNQVGCSPDAAIRMTKGFYLVAMMQLKAHSEINEEDLYRCRLMTCVSLLALDEGLKKETNSSDAPQCQSLYENLAMPFVLCNENVARLFVTRLKTANEVVSFTFTDLLTTPFCDSWLSYYQTGYNERENVQEKAEFMSILAILVADIFVLAARVSNRMEMNFHRKDNPQRKRLPNAIEGTVSPSSRRDSCSSEASNETQESRQDRSSQASNESQESSQDRVKPDAREDAARNVASWNGKVRNLKYPWMRIMDYNLDATKQEHWEAEMAFYMQKSPFYFRGMDGSIEVFCKVWREGDSNTYRNDIQEEIEFHRHAHECGVPSSKVFDELTAMDVVATGYKYHVLVSEYHRNDEVAEEDILEFAVLLVEAVLSLHSIGLLHCDIKRSNLLWDAVTKVVRLVDFGLAQKEENAQSYHATKHYEAPEIRENCPHSRLSDAYSVGKTIEEVIDERLDTPHAKDILNVSKLLQCPIVSERLSLEKAATMLSSLKVAPSTTRMKRSHEDMQSETTMENETVSCSDLNQSIQL